jgi:putative addiction module component (TIGR02574 family)
MKTSEKKMTLEETRVEYTNEFKVELDRRHAAYKEGSERPVTSDESKKRIQKLLKSSRK